MDMPAPVGTGDYALDDQVGYLLRLASQRHATIFASLVPEDLTPTQFSTLLRLAEHGASSQNHLGRLAAMDIATIKGVVDRLRRKGLVTVRPSAQDGRRREIALSDAGRDLIARLVAKGHEITAETLAPLSDAEQRTLVGLLRKLT